jgi:hypothetical protein
MALDLTNFWTKLQMTKNKGLKRKNDKKDLKVITNKIGKKRNLEINVK